MVMIIGKKNFNPYLFETPSKNYIVDDPRDLFKSYFSFGENHENFPSDHWELCIMYLLGSMQSGKSILINYICGLVENLWGENQCDFISTRDLGFSMWNAKITKNIVVLFVDDAVKTISGRDSMTKKQKTDTADFLEVRHIVGEYRKDTPKNGILFLIFASQTETGIDIRIRENYDLLFLKTCNYSNVNKNFEPELIDFLQEVNHKSFILHDSRFKGYFICRTRTNKQFKFYTPFKRFDKIVECNPEFTNLDLLRSEIINKFDLSDCNMSFVKGFMIKWAKKEKITISSSEMTILLYEAIFEQLSSNTRVKDQVLNEQQLLKIAEGMRDSNISFRKIAKILNMNHTTIFDKLRRKNDAKYNKARNEDQEENAN